MFDQTTLVIIILAIALILYTVFAGADFGAGVIGLFSHKNFQQKEKDLIADAMGPVWEANHIWLVLMIVILFVGFPNMLYVMNLYLHWPMTFALIGIVFRGCAFVFMHYDAVKDRSQKFYEKLFIYASAWSSFWLGVTLGTMSSGEMVTVGDPYEVYFRPWLQPYSLSVGVFVVFVFAALASIYLLDEARDEELRGFLIKKAKFFTCAMIVSGFVVFVLSYQTAGRMAERFLGHPLSLFCFVSATLLIVPLVWCLQREYFFKMKVIMAGMVTTVVVGWLSVLAPGALLLDGVKFNLHASAAPLATMNVLLSALVVGLLLIVPSLSYLLWVFKADKLQK